MADRAALRRLVSIPLYALLCALHLAALPLSLALAIAWDLLRRNHFATVRFLLFVALYLACEVAGIAAALALRALAWVSPAGDRGRHYALQRWWTGALFDGLRALYGFTLRVDGADCLAGGPLIVLVRHASTADTLLPMELVARRAGMHPRYALKRELLWDPCLDLVGQRIPNAFVRRGSGDAARESARVAALARGIGPRDAVVLYPEGTRFSRSRRDRALADIAQRDPERYARVRGLTRVLPVRPGGALALRAEAPDADVVFCVHRGWEATASLGALVRGAMRGARVDVALWRVPAAEVPREPEAALRWLDAQWARADAWLADVPGAPDAATRDAG